MSDSESSDGIDELQQLIDEYEAKEKKSTGSNGLKSEGAEQHKDEKKILCTPMDKVLFGNKEQLLKNLAKAVGEHVDDENDEDGDVLPLLGKKRKVAELQPVWTDADDEEIKVTDVKVKMARIGKLDHLQANKTYKEYLTDHYTRNIAQPAWASLERVSEAATVDEDDDEDLMRTVGFIDKRAAHSLMPGHLKHKRLRDLNNSTYAEGRITAIQFHSQNTAALVCGEKGVASIYSIAGKQHEKLHSICFENFPIKCAKIMPCGTKAIFGSYKRYYFSYDLLTAQETRRFVPKRHAVLRNIKFSNFQVSPCQRYLAVSGSYGQIHLFNAETHELLHSFKQEGEVAGMRFTSDSKRLISNSADTNEGFVFSLRAQRLEHRFVDEGCIKGSVLDLSPNQRMLAMGSKEGVVNVYDFAKLLQQQYPVPEKSFLNLTTGISDVKFNHSSELLAMCSQDVKGAVRVAHFPSATVYSNFPGLKAEIGKIGVVEFSPGSGYLALGNQRKEVPLFRLKSFNNY